MDPDIPLSGPRTMEEVMANGAVSETAQAACLAAFSMLALTLAAAGIYGLLAYVVAQRTGEFGIRLALGAQPATVVTSVLGDGMKATLVGSALGLGAAYLYPVPGVTLRAAAEWGVLSDGGVTGFAFKDYRLYAGAMYYLVSGASDGPYTELGLGLAHSSGGLLPQVTWPVVPHFGVGTIYRYGEETVWDLRFSATANGVLTLQGGIVFGAKNVDNGLTKPYEPTEQTQPW